MSMVEATVAPVEKRQRRGAAKAASVTFWSAGLGLTLSALAIPGVLVLFLLPLAGFWYLVFCLVAGAGDKP